MSTTTAFSRPQSLSLPSPLSRLAIYAVVAAASSIAYILSHALDGSAARAFAVVGLGACGWSWLLTRALFDPAEHDTWWPRVVVLILAGSAAAMVLAPDGGMLSRVSSNFYNLSGSAALLLTFVEPFLRYRRDLPVGEKRFRYLFVSIYALLVAASILGLWATSGSEEAARRDDLIKSACAVIAVIGAGVAVWFRLRHPLAALEPSPQKRAATSDDARLAERLSQLLRDEQVDIDPDLKIRDVAARLGEPEYRVSQCISAVMGFPNFNRLINHHRIERAKRMLVEGDRSILDVAFDCGFASVGPFNRAFKDQVGMTPRAWRRANRIAD